MYEHNSSYLFSYRVHVLWALNLNCTPHSVLWSNATPCVLCASSMGIAWERIRNAESRDPPQANCISRRNRLILQEIQISALRQWVTGRAGGVCVSESPGDLLKTHLPGLCTWCFRESRRRRQRPLPPSI